MYIELNSALTKHNNPQNVGLRQECKPRSW